MKRTIMLISALLILSLVQAQKGTVVYQETMKLDIHIDGDMPGVQDMLPKERKVQKVLYFTPDASLFINHENQEDQEVTGQAGGGNVVIKMEEPDDKLFIDLKEKKYTEQKEFMSRTFLIESALEDYAWKLTGNRKEIMGTLCLEATADKDSTHTVAWFAPSIPVSVGPGKYGGLPGLILEINVDNGKRVISAISLVQEDRSDLIRRPTKGKRVSREEFLAIVKEKTNQEGEGGGAVFMIKVTK